MAFVSDEPEWFINRLRAQFSPEDVEILLRGQWTITHHRKAEERRAIRNLVADRLTPLLTKHGFVRSHSTFFRIHGDFLLQVISVIFPSTQEPSVSVAIEPLYDAQSDFTIELNGMRTGTGWEGVALETMLGVAEDSSDPSYLAYQLDFDASIEKELELLRDLMIPKLDCTITANDYLTFYSCPSNPTPSVSIISPLLRAHRLNEAKPSILEYYKYYSDSLFEYNERRRIHPEIPEHPIMAKWVDLFEYLIHALEVDDYEMIQALFEKTIHKNYEVLSRYSKALVKQYPITLVSRQLPRVPSATPKHKKTSV